MSLLSPLLGAYWPARKEEKEACALRTLALLENLGKELQSTVWFPTGSRPKPQKPPIDLNLQSILPLLTTNNRDLDRKPIPELGFSLSIWNGDAKQPIGISITCGTFSSRQTNCVVINMPPANNFPIDLTESYGNILQAIIDAWEPDYAVATTMQAVAKFAPVTAASIKGWYVYRKGGPVQRAQFEG